MIEIPVGLHRSPLWIRNFNTLLLVSVPVKYNNNNLRGTEMCWCHIKEEKFSTFPEFIWPRESPYLNLPLFSLSSVCVEFFVSGWPVVSCVHSVPVTCSCVPHACSLFSCPWQRALFCFLNSTENILWGRMRNTLQKSLIGFSKGLSYLFQLIPADPMALSTENPVSSSRICMLFPTLKRIFNI